MMETGSGDDDGDGDSDDDDDDAVVVDCGEGEGGGGGDVALGESRLHATNEEAAHNPKMRVVRAVLCCSQRSNMAKMITKTYLVTSYRLLRGEVIR